MFHHGTSTVDSEESILDLSTAPTTPDGSLTFSPVLHAQKLHDNFEEITGRRLSQRRGRGSLDATVETAGSRSRSIKNICCVGAGYVGGPTAAVMAFQNPHLNVTVVDRDPVRIAQWKTKHVPIYEPGLYDILRIARDGARETSFVNEPLRAGSLDSISSSSSATSECESQCGEHPEEIHISARTPNLFFSTEISKSISEADIVLIAVNTPTKSRGLGAGRATDVTALEAVTREIAIHAKPGAILVEKSTVPCRTADIIRDTLKVHRPNLNFEILSNPEFLAAGTAINDLLYPDRVVIGSSNTPAGHQAAEALASVYASWVPRSKIVSTNIWSSELSKLVANSMLAQRISSINSISAICEKTGADVDEVAKSIGLDPRIGSKFLRAGLGFGGSCFKKDILSLVYLAESLGLDEVAEYWQQAVTINEFQRVRFVKRVIKCLNGTLVGKKLTVLGYAFKKDTNDTRESPALDGIRGLLEDAPAEVAVFDPCCDPKVVRHEIGRLLGKDVLKEYGGAVEVYADAYQASHKAHAVLIMTECDEFKNTRISTPELRASNISRAKLDPRPFQRLQTNESEILNLQKHLTSALGDADPLHRFEEEPSCNEGCKPCKDSAAASPIGKGKQNERLDWARIAYHLQRPKWVFDGRNVLDVPEMEALGVRVEGIGKIGFLGRA